MKRKIRQRVWMSLVLVAALLILPVNSSYAAGGNLEQIEAQRAQIGGGGTVDPQYVKTATITADLSIRGNNAHAYADAVAKKVCHISIVMRLQRKEGNSWVTKVSWVGASDSGLKTMSRDFTLTQRGTYRTYAAYNVGGEELTYKSATQVY